jgi:acyl-CoA thioester hydrolase
MPAPVTFTHVERVRYGDLDAMRHLNNVVFLRYFESARIAFVRSLAPGHDPADPNRGPRGLIFAECHIAYRCWVAELRSSSFKVGFEMRVGERVVADGYGWLVGFDYEEQKPAPLAADLRARLEAVLQAPDGVA